MRILFTGLIFIASLAAAVFVHAARADAAWGPRQQIDAGHRPQVRVQDDGGLWLAYAQGDPWNPSHVAASRGNEPLRRVRARSSRRMVVFDVEGSGRLVALREVTRRGRRRIEALESNRWRAISPASSTAVDARLAVADSGAAVALWLQYEQSHYVVHAAHRRPGVRRFGPSQRLSGLTARGGQTIALAIDDAGTAVATWAEDGDLVMARTVGGTFTTPVRVHDRTTTAAGAFAVAAAVRGETAAVAFTRLEDREPPEYRLQVATQVGDTAPVVETVARNVSALDVATAVDGEGAPLALTAPIGPPYSLRLHRRAPTWTEQAAIPATEAPSTIGLAVPPAIGPPPCITWTEGNRGFATLGADRLSLGRAENPDCSVNEYHVAAVVWDRGGNRSQRLANFSPRP